MVVYFCRNESLNDLQLRKTHQLSKFVKASLNKSQKNFDLKKISLTYKTDIFLFLFVCINLLRNPINAIIQVHFLIKNEFDISIKWNIIKLPF